METKKLTYEAPEAQVFGVETQDQFLLASGGGAQASSMDVEDVDQWDY